MLVAELIKSVRPGLIELHNYPTVLNSNQKKANWVLLKNKVLKKLRVKIKDSEIDDIINGKQHAVEYFLGRLKDGLENPVAEDNFKPKSQSSLLEVEKVEFVQSKSKINVNAIKDAINGRNVISEPKDDDYEKDLEEVLGLKNKLDELEKNLNDYYKLLAAKDRKIKMLEEQLVQRNIVF